ncbi:MAG: hypothetical protein KKB62_01895 [Nanoarchaeota archaeon]|nr:hypothetical protein [Nanoarchaeota archaeon]
MADYSARKPKFPPLTSKEIEERYSEMQEEMKEVLDWKKEEKDRLINGKTPQARAAAKRALPKVARRIDTVNGNLIYWKLRKEGKSHFHANIERAEYWDKLKNKSFLGEGQD